MAPALTFSPKCPEDAQKNLGCYTLSTLVFWEGQKSLHLKHLRNHSVYRVFGHALHFSCFSICANGTSP